MKKTVLIAAVLGTCILLAGIGFTVVALMNADQPQVQEMPAETPEPTKFARAAVTEIPSTTPTPAPSATPIPYPITKLKVLDGPGKVTAQVVSVKVLCFSASGLKTEPGPMNTCPKGSQPQWDIPEDFQSTRRVGVMKGDTSSGPILLNGHYFLNGKTGVFAYIEKSTEGITRLQITDVNGSTFKYILESRKEFKADSQDALDASEGRWAKQNQVVIVTCSGKLIKGQYEDRIFLYWTRIK